MSNVLPKSHIPLLFPKSDWPRPLIALIRFWIGGSLLLSSYDNYLNGGIDNAGLLSAIFFVEGRIGISFILLIAFGSLTLYLSYINYRIPAWNSEKLGIIYTRMLLILFGSFTIVLLYQRTRIGLYAAYCVGYSSTAVGLIATLDGILTLGGKGTDWSKLFRN